MSEQMPERIRKVKFEGDDTERELVIGACITRSAKDSEEKDSREYLLVRGGKPDDKWHFPGGRVRAGETVKSALKRELGEELALKFGENYTGPFEKLDAGPYSVKEKNFAIVNVSLPQDSLNIEPQLGSDAAEKVWTSNPLEYDLLEQTKEVLEAKLGKSEKKLGFRQMTEVSEEKRKSANPPIGSIEGPKGSFS